MERPVSQRTVRERWTTLLSRRQLLRAVGGTVWGTCRLGPPASLERIAHSTVSQSETRERPPLPPRWAFGHIKSKDEFKGREDILSDIAWMEENDVPCQVVHIDAPWASGHNVFEFARSRVLLSKLHPETVGEVYDFSAPGENPYAADPTDPLCRPSTPGPHIGQDLIATLHNKDIRVTVWITPIINNGTGFGIGQFQGQAEREAQLFAFAESKGFLVPELKTWHRGVGKLIDYKNPEAVGWWRRMMDKVCNMGVDGFVLDLTPNVGADYFLQYVSGTFHYLRDRKGAAAIMMSRSSKEVAGVTLLVWAIDTKNDFSDRGIKYALEQVIEGSQRGTPYVSGTQSPRGDAPTERFIAREVQLNAFCPVQFTFCYGDLSNPWEHGETATRVFKYYTRLHNELLPYIYSAAIHAHRTGDPIIKGTSGDLQYTFGADLLVAPVYRDEVSRRVTFPDGDWIDYCDEGKVYSGGREIEYEAPLERIPLFLRTGAMVPLEVTKNWTGHGTENSAGALTVLVYPSGSVERWFHDLSGDTLFRCTKSGHYLKTANVRFEIQGRPREYLLRFKTFAQPLRVLTHRGGLLPRQETETRLTAGKGSWCYNRTTSTTIVRLPAAGSEALELHF